jgi:hypothetical protein
MHLCGPELTTTSTKKRKQKLTKFQQEELERNWRDRNQWLKKEGLPTQTYEQFLEWVYGSGKKEKKFEKGSASQKQSSSSSTNKHTTKPENNSSYYWKNIQSHSSSEIIPTACAKKPSPTYTGEKVLGVAVLHKSCLQPVFSQEEAVEVAKMRR